MSSGQSLADLGLILDDGDANDGRLHGPSPSIVYSRNRRALPISVAMQTANWRVFCPYRDGCQIAGKEFSMQFDKVLCLGFWAHCAWNSRTPSAKLSTRRFLHRRSAPPGPFMCALGRKESKNHDSFRSAGRPTQVQRGIRRRSGATGPH
jgi:hypothetical protein